MVEHITYIAFLTVYSVILIIITSNYTKYMTVIKQWFKSRKKQKQQQLEDTIKEIVLGYLKQLQNNEENKTLKEEWNSSKTVEDSKYIGAEKSKIRGH